MATPAVTDPKARILVVTNNVSSLTRERAVVGCSGGYSVYWYSLPRCFIEGVAGYDGPPAGSNRLWQHVLSPFYLARALMVFKPDLVHVHWAIQRLLTPVLTRFRPLVVTIMGGDILPDQVYRGVNRLFVKQLLNAADVITSKSAFLDEALKTVGPYTPKLRRITWGVDMEQFRPGLDTTYLRQKWLLAPDDFVFFCLRNCHPLYNKHLVIQAFAECLQSTGNGIKLLISELGADPTYQQQLKDLVANLHLEEHVRFVGAVPPHDMPLYFNLAKVAISVPRSDGMPQSLYESMACGTFHILSDLPQYHELVTDGETGRLVPLNNPVALKEAMLWSITHPQQLADVAARGRAKITEVANKAEQVDRMNNIYADLLKIYRKGS